MIFYPQAYRIYDYGSPASFGAFCSECDEEITGLDPCYYEPDGDVDDEGRAIDASTYLCASCGVTKEISE